MVTVSRSLRLGAATLAVMILCRAMPVLAPAAVMMTATQAEARAGSSGGYSRPSVRTPSARAPSGSGGYRRPSVGGTLSVPRSSSDVELSRRGSAEALQRYRDSTAPRRPSTSDAPYTSRRGWTPPPYASQTPGLGMGQALMMWFLLDTLTRPGHADFFHNHQDDPTYRDWRREAEKRAESDPELRAKLNALDTDLAQLSGQPKDPDYVPADVPKASGPSFPLLPVALLAITLLVLWRARRRLAKGTPGSLAARMLRQKISPTAPASPFRVGMTLTLDPTPFVLAQSATKVRAPAGTLVSATAISRLDPFDRIYLAEGFFQLHRTGSAVDECRWFSPLDQFTPADEQEWAFWLDPTEGMIGWPSFETKDSKTYQRLWQPGGQRIAPRAFMEQVSDASGTTTRQVSAMLYAAPTGLTPPAPDTEYVWVAAVEASGQAWVEIHAGLDVNPASLSLPL